jgi:hypothetical protein
MHETLNPSVARVVRVLLGLAIGGLVFVGANEMGMGIAALVLAVGGFGFVTALMWLGRDGLGERRLWRLAGRYAWWAVAILLAFIGSIAALDGLSVLLGMGSLLAWWWLSGRRRDTASAPASVHGSGPADVVVLSLGPVRPGQTVNDLESLMRSLDGAALARVWKACRSADGASPARQLELAGVRKMLLDELERRDPVAFSEWLARGAPDDPPLPLSA